MILSVENKLVDLSAPSGGLSLGMLYGQPLTEIPEELFIPPDALAVFLESFEGPLDLLLYLIRKQNIDILDIPMAVLTEQYLAYIDWMEGSRFELAADYLLMAATLIDIKVRLLLPKPASVEMEEADPRSELVKRLLEYEHTQRQARALTEHELSNIHFWPVSDRYRGGEQQPVLPNVSSADLADAWLRIIKRTQLDSHHIVSRESLSVRAHMVLILEKLSSHQRTEFSDLFKNTSSRAVIVVHFLALLELVREQLIEIIQVAPGSPIYLLLRGTENVC